MMGELILHSKIMEDFKKALAAIEEGIEGYRTRI